MSRVFHISDAHFGHKNILNFRKIFSSIEEHDETIMQNILSSCGKRDTLWMHGDMFFTGESINKLEEICKYVGHVRLILGNHDVERMSSDRRRMGLEKILSTGAGVFSLATKGGFWLTHAPIHPDELRGKFCCHGHVHDATLSDYRYINVSCENINYKPVERKTIDQYINEKEIFTLI